jgi:hypothetical protein
VIVIVKYKDMYRKKGRKLSTTKKKGEKKTDQEKKQMREKRKCHLSTPPDNGLKNCPLFWCD